MKLSKIIQFKHNENWYRIQRDLVTYKNSDSFLPVLEEHFMVGVSDKKDSPGWSCLEFRIDEVSNIESLQFILSYAFHQIKHSLSKFFPGKKRLPESK